MSKAVNSVSPQGTGQGSRTTRNTQKQLSNKELGIRITTLWDEISDDPRDPKVIEFIRLLREFGKRNEVAAFALMDHLDHEDHYKRWLMARVAIAGGWALRDPAAASKALFEDGTVLPKDFEKKTGLPIILQNEFPQSNHFAPSCSQIAILRQASAIFRAWSQSDPEEAKKFANSLPENRTSSGLRRMLRKHLHGFGEPDPGDATIGLRAGSAPFDRNSIDAILSNPQRTSVYSNSTYGLEIYGDVLPEGELAFTYEEWAARNPELAEKALKPKAVENTKYYPSGSWMSYPAWSENLLAGLARKDSDYLGLLEFGPPVDPFIKANILIQTLTTNTADEGVWQLDGRESTWTLNLEERKAAMEKLIENGGFSESERSDLTSTMNGETESLIFLLPPELPSKRGEEATVTPLPLDVTPSNKKPD